MAGTRPKQPRTFRSVGEHDVLPRQERRVMVRFHLPKDRDTGRMQLALLFMGRDVKHSKNWLCEFCGPCQASRSMPV